MSNFNPPWNKGLIKETDDRVRQNGLASSTSKQLNPIIWTEESKKKLSQVARKKKFGYWNKDKKRSLEFKERVSRILTGTKHKHHKKPFPFTDEHRKNMRIAHIEYAKKMGLQWHSVGKSEKTVLDTQELIDNCVILRQYKIEKAGYIVDGYCPETNTVYEVYEPYHNKQVKKDLDRETEICNFLSCDFMIIWTKNYDRTLSKRYQTSN